MALVHLIYVSSARAEPGADELGHLLDSAARHNAAQAVTGMLLYFSGNFMQVLEGEDAAVDETYSRIVLDQRHASVIVLDRAAIKTRTFGHWHMGFRRVEAADAAAHPAYAPFFNADSDAADIGARDGFALEMLKVFARNQGA
jgi:hypothetical protein